MQIPERFPGESFGYSPSIREISDFIGVRSPLWWTIILRQLEDMGYISRDGHVRAASAS